MHRSPSIGESSSPAHQAKSSDALWRVGGEVAGHCRELDWAATSLGPIDHWPKSLRTMANIVLSSRFAMWMGYGPELTFLYNDAYGRMSLGSKHPWALGKPASVVWAEIWNDIGPRIETVMKTGEATWDEALLLFLERSGFTEETYHTFSYSPITDDDGTVAGMLCVVSEDTERVIGQRRLDSLRELAAGLASATREDQVLDVVSRALSHNAKDLPFTLTYLFDSADPTSARARLACATGVPTGHAVAPATLTCAIGRDLWPVSDIRSGESHFVVDDLPSRFESLPRGDWDRVPKRAVVVPIAQPGQDRPAGCLVAALNPFRPLDDEYRGFVELVAGQIGAGLANARAYEEERRRAEQLAALDRAKTQFFSNVSHEFRTPLTLLLGPTEDALADAEATPEQRERVALIHRNALRLLRLVNTLLEFSRIEAGRVRARFEPTALGHLTADLASSFRSAVERAGLRLLIDAPELPDPLGAVYVDREMWEKIVLNLLSNAFKHTFDGEIAVRLRAEGRQAVLSVRDTGVGISAEQLPHIFERFHRVPNARSRTHEGTGIGLSLVEELVRLHGGAIDVTSVPGVGTTFTVRIPSGTGHLPADHVVESPARAEPAQSHTTGALYVEEALRWLPDEAVDGGDRSSAFVTHEALDTGQRPLMGFCVLVADDNADMRDYVTRLLRERGARVEAVADGRSALTQAQAHAPDLILSDVMMPGLDGFELLRALRADPITRTVPVILLSARAGEEARVEGIEAGADDYLVKPFSARELVARVEGRIELHRMRRAREQEREQLLAFVEAERARLQKLVAHAPAAIAVLRGPDHVVESVNEQLEVLIGNRAVIGKPIRDGLPELASQGVIDWFDEVYRTGRPVFGDATPLKVDSDGTGELEQHFFTFVYQPIFSGEPGEVTGIFVHAVEVTDQVRARREAEAARVAAENANRAKSDFLAAMSHELRTPLNAIGGYVQLLALGIHGPVSDEQMQALQRVQRSQQHLLSLINDVLNFAKLEAGRVEYAMRPVSLSDTMAAVMPMIEPQLNEKHLEYTVEVESNAVAHADPEKLQQILLNLLSNAIKFTDSGGRITVAASADDARRDRVALSVRDTGIGIPREKHESIFDPFVQAHRNLTSSTEGTGLGLAISRDLARAMGGELSVDSEPGLGATFTLSLQTASA